MSGRRSQSKPGSYAVLNREWNSGDTVDVSMPFTLHTEGFRDNPRRFALMHGPLVLAAEVPPGKPFPAIVAEENQPGKPSAGGRQALDFHGAG